MSANNQTLIKEHEGKWYVFTDINAEAWQEGTHKLDKEKADFVADNRDEAYLKALELDEKSGVWGSGTEYGVQFNRLCKDESCDCHISPLSESALKAVNTPLVGADGKPSNMAHTNWCADFAENGLCNCPLKGRGGQCKGGECFHNK